MAKGIWQIEEKIRQLLLSGVEFPHGRTVAASIGSDMFTWVKLNEDTKPKRVMVVYTKYAVRVTVHAVIHDDGRVEIESVSLDTMCGEIGGGYG
jgi:copper(I)-binding protein